MCRSVLVLVMLFVGLGTTQHASIAQAESPGARIRIHGQNGLMNSDQFAEVVRSGGAAPAIESDLGKLYWDFWYAFTQQVVPSVNLSPSGGSIACYEGNPLSISAIMEGLISYTEINGEEVPSLRHFRITSDDSVSFEARNTRADRQEDRERFLLITLPRCQALTS